MISKTAIKNSLVSAAFFLIISSQILVGQLAYASPDTQPTVVKLLRSDEEAIILEFSAADFQSQEQWIDNERFHSLSLFETGYISQAGYPQLPIKGVLAAVPPKSEARLTVLESSDVLLSGYHIPPVPREIPPEAEVVEDEPQPVRYEYKEDPTIYSSNSFYPDKPADIRFSGILRDYHVVCIQFYPLRYNPVTEQLYFHKNIKVQVSFAEKSEEHNVGTRHAVSLPATPFEPLYRSTILNYESAWKWRAEMQAGRLRSQTQTVTMGSSYALPNLYKIYIREPGIYILDDSDLKNAGLNLSLIDPRKIILTNRGKEIPVYIYGEEDGRFDAGDYIEFYGTVYKEDYSPYNVYWLSAGTSDGLRIKERDGSINEASPVPESFLYTVHEEKNKLHWATFPNSETLDRFFWERIIAPKKADYDVNIAHLAATKENCIVRVMIQGNTELAHHVRTYLNGQLLKDITWYGQTRHLTEAQMPQTLLREGTNTITIELPGDIADVDAIYLNWIAIDYHRRYIADNDSLKFKWRGDGIYRFKVEGFTKDDISVFDITDATNPVRMTGLEIDPIDSKYQTSFQDEGRIAKTYLALTAAQRRRPVKIVEDIPSYLRSTENGSDYIIITHRDFHESIMPLVQLREQEGARVKVVEIADIYDEFSYGLPSDQSIRDFLQYAYHYWIPPAPFCVLLAGDASYDHKDYFGLGDINFVPTHLFNAPYLGDAANDTWFVTVDGGDELPDMIVGRLPASTTAQAEAIVEKIINYERYTAPGDWQKRILLVADNEKIFEEDSEQLVEEIPASYKVKKVYLSATPSASASRMILDAMSEGCILVNYTGHGAWSTWAGEKILKTEDIPLLNRTNMLPFVVNMTCLAGYFHYPYPRRDDILGEHLIRTAGKGAIGVLTPAGASLPGWQSVFNKLLFENFFAHRHQRLGTAIMEAKISLIVNNVWGEESEIYNLLGDAALKIAMPQVSAAWDVNSDGIVDFLDFVMVASHFLERITPFAHPNPDVNGDGVVDILDLTIVGTHFGEKYE